MVMSTANKVIKIKNTIFEENLLIFILYENWSVCHQEI